MFLTISYKYKTGFKIHKNELIYHYIRDKQSVHLLYTLIMSTSSITSVTIPSVSLDTTDTNNESYVSPNDPDYHFYVVRDDIPDTQKNLYNLDPSWVNGTTYPSYSYQLDLFKRFGPTGISRWVAVYLDDTVS